MSLIPPNMNKGRSDFFKSRFVPFRYLLTDNDNSVTESWCLKTSKPVAVAVHSFMPSFDIDAEKSNAFNHPNLTSLIDILPDLEAGLYYMVSESPKKYCSIGTFVTDICKKTNIRQNLHFVMKELLALFMALQANKLGLEELSEKAIVITVCNGNIEGIKVRRELLNKKPNTIAFKTNLITVARLFSNVYDDIPNGASKILRPEMGFFLGCLSSEISLKHLMHDENYISGDPTQWPDDDFANGAPGSDWDVVTDVEIENIQVLTEMHEEPLSSTPHSPNGLQNFLEWFLS